MKLRLLPSAQSASGAPRSCVLVAIGAIGALVAIGAGGMACSSSGASDPGGVRPADQERSASGEHVARTSSPVINGKNSDKSQDAVVLLIHYDRAQRDFGACTGTLLSPRLVLTARHCVADTDASAACDATGAPLALGAVRSNHVASTMYVFTGTKRPDFYAGEVTPAGVGMKILDDGGKNLCNHDIALLLLKEPIVDAKIAPIRLDSPIVKTDVLTAIGWGVTDATPQPDVRQQRTGIKILGIGPDDTGDFPVPPNEFQVGESICSGDSGGPALAGTGAIVGVVSRGGNATKPNPNNPSAGCIGGENLYTKVAPFKDLILSGFAAVEADPWYENGADPRLAKAGTACTDGAQCRSNQCLFADPNQPAVTTCAQDCSVSACPAEQVCAVVGESKVCRPPSTLPSAATTTTTTTGCATAPTGPSRQVSLAAGGLGLAALGLLMLRRRRRVTAARGAR